MLSACKIVIGLLYLSQSLLHSLSLLSPSPHINTLINKHSLIYFNFCDRYKRTNYGHCGVSLLILLTCTHTKYFLSPSPSSSSSSSSLVCSMTLPALLLLLLLDLLLRFFLLKKKKISKISFFHHHRQQQHNMEIRINPNYTSFLKDYVTTCKNTPPSQYIIECTRTQHLPNLDLCFQQKG